MYLNDAAAAAFRELGRFSAGENKVFAHRYRSDRIVGATGWFEQASAVASVKNVRWHDLRHTFASRLVVAGVDIRTVQELMGHKQIQVTLRYAYVAPQHQLQAVQRLCDTAYTPNGPTDTKPETGGFEKSEARMVSIN